MSKRRMLVLTFGPFVIVAFCYWATMTGAKDGAAAVLLPTTDAQALDAVPDGGRLTALQTACEQTAAHLAARLRGDCRVLVRTPYVLAGDLTEAALEQAYDETIVPTSWALSTCYFDNGPTEPIMLLLFSNERTYHRYAAELDGRIRAAYYGYYQKSERRVVLNASTGNGTLAHELTHALSHFDFPAMPEWFDEGLASLHEQSEFSEDGLQLRGLWNWRVYHLLHAIKHGRLRPVDALLRENTVRCGQEAVDYAHARYLCLYLQERGLLTHFYRKLRVSIVGDPTGYRTLCALLHADSLEDFDDAFRQWVIDHHKAHRSAIQSTGSGRRPTEEAACLPQPTPLSSFE